MHSLLESLIKCHSVLLSFYLKMYLIQSSSKQLNIQAKIILFKCGITTKD